MVVSNIFGMFTPILAELIQFDEHISQMDWFNHQQLNQLICFFHVLFLKELIIKWGPMFTEDMKIHAKTLAILKDFGLEKSAPGLVI